MNNVVSLEHSVILRVENAIIDALSNRAGKYVAPHIMTIAADRVAPPNVNIFAVIGKMVNDNVLERTHYTTFDKFGTAIELPMYRLTPIYS